MAWHVPQSEEELSDRLPELHEAGGDGDRPRRSPAAVTGWPQPATFDDGADAASADRPDSPSRQALEYVERSGFQVVSTAAPAFGSLEKYEPRDLVITVGAGMRLRALQRLLADEGQWLPVADGRGRGTVGGLVAGGAVGDLDPLAGSIRRHVLAVRAVAHDGRRFRWGRPVVKNVAGYDVQGLWCGSRGRLGVLTEVSFRVWAKPAVDRTVRIVGDDTLALLDAFVRIAPCESFAPDAVRWTGGAERREAGRANGTDSLWVRFFGTAEAVEARARRLTEWCRGQGTGVVEDDQDAGVASARGRPPSTGEGDRRAGAAGDRAGGPTEGSPTDRRPSIDRVTLAARVRRADLASALRRVREAAAPGLVALEGYPLESALRIEYERPLGPDDEAVPGYGRTLEALGEVPVTLLRGGPAEHAALEAAPALGVRTLERQVVAALGGGRRAWIADYV